MKRILDCQSSDFRNMSRQELLDAIAGSEGRTIACETIGAIMPMLGDITNAEFAAAMGADILLLNVFDVQKPHIQGLPKTEPENVIRKLGTHKVNTDYIRKTRNGMGTWLAVFDNDGDVVASISKRPNLLPIVDILDKHGDDIFANADSVICEIDIDKEIVKRVFKLAKKHNKKVFSVVGNMSIALERRDFMKSIDCFVCNTQEAGLLFYRRA